VDKAAFCLPAWAVKRKQGKSLNSGNKHLKIFLTILIYLWREE